MAISTNFDEPESRKSIFTGIRRCDLDHFDFAQAYIFDREVRFYFPFVWKPSMICGHVVQITTYPDGELVRIMPKQTGRFDGFESWKPVPLWISKHGPCGILCLWETNRQKRSQSSLPPPPAIRPLRTISVGMSLSLH